MMNKNRNNIFLYLLLGWILAHVWMLWLPKGTVEWILNQHWTPFLDQFFSYYTEIGSGLLFIPVAILAWLIDKRLVLVVIVSFLIMTLFSQGLKNIIDHMPRPASFFEGLKDLHLAEGIDHHCCRSFPSGHTASAFSVFSLLALLLGNQKLTSVIVFVLAAMAGFSRVYLLQHFFVDVISGAILGVLATYLCYGVFLRLYHKRNWTLKMQNKPHLGLPMPILEMKQIWS
jgi:membrane-associated phospholipid phosphatase